MIHFHTYITKDIGLKSTHFRNITNIQCLYIALHPFFQLSLIHTKKPSSNISQKNL